MSEFASGFETIDPWPDAQEATLRGHGPQLVYADPVEFFVEILGPSYVREVNNGSEFTWCPECYKHAEALARIETLWRAWEHLRHDGALGLSTWWLHHADPHMRILLAPNGPFKRCVYEGHQPADRPDHRTLPHQALDRDLYTRGPV